MVIHDGMERVHEKVLVPMGYFVLFGKWRKTPVILANSLIETRIQYVLSDTTRETSC